MAEFVDAYSKSTGRKHRVPAHFFDIQSLSRNLSKTPTQKARENASETPSDVWTVAELKQYAVDHDIDLAGATVKADILTAIHTPTTSTTETPAPGEEE